MLNCLYVNSVGDFFLRSLYIERDPLMSRVRATPDYVLSTRVKGAVHRAVKVISRRARERKKTIHTYIHKYVIYIADFIEHYL